MNLKKIKSYSKLLTVKTVGFVNINGKNFPYKIKLFLRNPLINSTYNNK